MTREEAIETLKANYPDACYEQLREAVDTAISALRTDGDTISRQPENIRCKDCKSHRFCAIEDEVLRETGETEFFCKWGERG